MANRQLSDYEKLREAKIARNNARLSSLGLTNAAEAMRKSVKNSTKKKKVVAKKTATVAARQSSRIRKKPDALVVGGPGYFKAEKADGGNDDDSSESDAESAIVAKSEEIISKMRLEMETLRRNTIDASNLPCKGRGEENYRDQAIKLWGEKCFPPPSCSWKTFVTSRLPTPSLELPSPLCLMQELYTHDGWAFLCSCVLMTRVSSHDTKDRCIKGFFELCPSPSDFEKLSVEKLKETINSLGFQFERMKGLSEVTNAWLTRPEFTLDVVAVEKGGNKIAQCGAFAVDSFFTIFRGDVDHQVVCKIKDIERFQKWQRSTIK